MFGFIFHRTLFWISVHHKKITLLRVVQFKMQALKVS